MSDVFQKKCRLIKITLPLILNKEKQEESKKKEEAAAKKSIATPVTIEEKKIIHCEKHTEYNRYCDECGK